MGKKNSKIKIIKEDKNISESYTFIDDSLFQSSESPSNYEKDGQRIDSNKSIENQNKRNRRKGELKQDSKGLKFLKPSQRNHSSIYE